MLRGGGRGISLRIGQRGDLLGENLLADGDLTEGGVGHLLVLQLLLAAAVGQIELHHGFAPFPRRSFGRFAWPWGCCSGVTTSTDTLPVTTWPQTRRTNSL